MQLDTALEGPETGAASEELAEALLLIRGSALKLARLQLALERNDRQVALEAVDELVAFDRRLGDQLAKASPARSHAYLLNQLEVERSALNREKLTLAAGISNGRCSRDHLLRTAASRIEGASIERATGAAPIREAIILLDEDPEEGFDLLSENADVPPQIISDDARPRLKWRIALAIFMILVLASAAVVATLSGFSFARNLLEAISNWH